VGASSLGWLFTAAGTWQTARTVAPPPVLNHGQYATINAIDCPSPGNCTAVGRFTNITRGDVGARRR
jgi:hypothetical protein